MLITLNTDYKCTAFICQCHFQDEPELIKELGLNMWRVRTIPPFISQATNVYSNAMKKQHILDKLEVFNYTVERLQEELNEIEELQQLYKKYRTTIGESQQLTADLLLTSYFLLPSFLIFVSLRVTSWLKKKEKNLRAFYRIVNAFAANLFSPRNGVDFSCD